jgi:hypothetical protein
MFHFDLKICEDTYNKLVALYFCPNCGKTSKKLLPYERRHFLKVYSLLQNTIFDSHPIRCKRCFQKMMLKRVIDTVGNIILDTHQLLNSGLVQHYKPFKN